MHMARIHVIVDDSPKLQLENLQSLPFIQGALMIDSNETMRKQVLSALCVTLMVMAIPMSIGNSFVFPNKSYALSLIEASYILLGGYSLYKIRDNQNVTLHSHIHVFFIATAICFAEYAKPIEEGIYIWSCSVPLLFYLLLGSRNSLTYSMGLLFIQLSILLYEIALYNKHEYILSVINFLCVYLVVTAVSRKYEKEREGSKLYARYLGSHDLLTGALSRNSLLQTLNNDFSDYNSFIMFDIDNLKKISSKFGYAYSDKLIKDVVQRSYTIINRDYLYYLGEGRFVVLIKSDSFRESTVNEFNLVNDIQQTISTTPFAINEQKVTVTLSSGIAELKKFNTIEHVWYEAEGNLILARGHGPSSIFKNRTSLVS